MFPFLWLLLKTAEIGPKEAHKRPKRGLEEVRKRPGRGPQVALKRPRRSPKEAQKRPGKVLKVAQKRPGSGPDEAQKVPPIDQLSRKSQTSPTKSPMAPCTMLHTDLLTNKEKVILNLYCNGRLGMLITGIGILWHTLEYFIFLVYNF